MGITIQTALVFKNRVQKPLLLKSSLEFRDATEPKSSGSDPLISVEKDSRGDFWLKSSQRCPVAVNGRSIPKRPLRDGDEIVFGHRVCMFRQAAAHSDLDDDMTWDVLDPTGMREFAGDLLSQFFKFLDSCGRPARDPKQHPVEDWREAKILGPHFGFGRRRVLHFDDAIGVGLDLSKWDIVGSGTPVVIRQRLTSIGLPNVVIKWELARRGTDIALPFVHEKLILGWRDTKDRKTVQAALESMFGAASVLVNATDEQLWSMQHTDRILSLPSQAGQNPDDAVYSSISRL